MDNYYFHMDNLSVGYDKKALIHDICIGIKKGEIVTLIGPNGSGKSTILKSITRQLQIIGGKVYFDDRNLNSFSYKELSTRMAVVLSLIHIFTPTPETEAEKTAVAAETPVQENVTTEEENTETTATPAAGDACLLYTSRCV